MSACADACAGGPTVRAGRLQPRMRTAFLRRLDLNHNALLLINAANRWLGLSLVSFFRFSFKSFRTLSVCPEQRWLTVDDSKFFSQRSHFLFFKGSSCCLFCAMVANLIRWLTLVYRLALHTSLGT